MNSYHNFPKLKNNYGLPPNGFAKNQYSKSDFQDTNIKWMKTKPQSLRNEKIYSQSNVDFKTINPHIQNNRNYRNDIKSYLIAKIYFFQIKNDF